MKKIYDVQFVVDSSHVPHLGTTLYSLLLNNTWCQFRVYIFTEYISKSDQYIIESIAAPFGCMVKFILIDNKYAEGFSTPFHLNKATYYKWLVADYINADKCLYLDVDLVVNQTIQDLLDVDLTNHILGAVENPGFTDHNELCMHSSAKYFNAGVMIINTKKWKENQVKEKAIHFSLTQSHSVQSGDQAPLNGVLNGDWLSLDPKFNVQTRMLKDSKFTEYFRKNLPVIIHYTGTSKPWNFDNRHPYRGLYWKYRNQTPFRMNSFDFLNQRDLMSFFIPYKIKKHFNRK
jgi:lipopolysaccharide biosynthesis glycosyltransferase